MIRNVALVVNFTIVLVVAIMLVVICLTIPRTQPAEQVPPEPPSFHKEWVSREFMRIDDYERGVTCYHYYKGGGVWCYVSEIKP